MDSLAIHSKVSFGRHVDKVGQPKRVVEIPIGTRLADPLVSSTRWQIGNEIKNDSMLVVSANPIPAESVFEKSPLRVEGRGSAKSSWCSRRGWDGQHPDG